MHLVGFTIEIFYDARPCERQKVYKHIIIIIIALCLFLSLCVYIYIYFFLLFNYCWCRNW
jgi:hypothetical protein